MAETDCGNNCSVLAPTDLHIPQTPHADINLLITPRQRRKGVKIITPVFEDSSAESPASPLSGVTDIDYSYDHHNNNNPFLYKNQFKLSNPLNIDKYQQKLNALNGLSSPMQLFQDIDLMIKNYEKLKKEYCLQWELQQLYRQQIRSLLKQKKRNQTQSDHDDNHESLMPLNDIESLIQRLQNIQFSIAEIFQKCLNQKKKRIRNKSSVENENIKPSHAKRLSGSSLTEITKAKKTKYKYNQYKKKNNNKRTRKDKYKYNQYSLSSPCSYDADYITEYNVNNNNNNNNNNNKTNNITKDLQNKLQLLTQSKPKPTTTTTTTTATATATATTATSSRSRRSSVRSFGALYSDQFRNEVARNYKQSITFKDEFKSQTQMIMNQLQPVEYYHDNYIGQNELFDSPFGLRPLIYCDWTASGKALKCVETYINEAMLPLYANTHTTTSITGTQTSKLRSESRSIILESLKGDHNQDVVIFCGSGSTAAIYKLANVLMKSVNKSYRPETSIVFISVYEHNSNIFIWKELGCKVVVIPENNNNVKKGGIDLKTLEKHLIFYTSQHMKQKYHLLIGSFTAASNVSGIIAPIDETTLLLHKYGALSFWDYATAGPYLDVNMTNKQNPLLSKDAVFISTHKYLAGPGSPGILCGKKKLFQNYVPVVPGGGTVFMAYGINDGEWDYLDNIEEREEGGTPDIIGSVRASFAFMVKDHITTQFIENREREYLEYFLSECKQIDNLMIMGNTECNRLPVISFLITHTKNGFGAAKKTKYLHYNFIAALMNDLFGIQGRGGCACAGMYGKYVLDITDQEVDYVINQMRDKQNELARPGYFRINLHYTLNKEELKYIINAIKFICKKGWLFVSLYHVDAESGNYYHRNSKKNTLSLRSLLDISFNKNNGKMVWKKNEKDSISIKNNNNNDLNKYFKVANDIITNLNKYLPQMDEFKNEKNLCDESAWYWLPSELLNDAKNYI